MTEPPSQAKVVLAWLSTIRAGPAPTCTWKVTEPVSPDVIVPAAKTTAPLPAGAMKPASSPTASVRGAPFQRSVPGTYAVPTGIVSAGSTPDAVPRPAAGWANVH